MILKQAFKDMQEAWSPVLDIDYEYQASEVNPQFANIVSPTEVVVISTFHVDLEGGGGDMHVTMPYSMIEPIRDLLDAGVQSDRSDIDERWTKSLQEEMHGASVEMSSTLLKTEITLNEVVDLKAGDIIPVDLPEQVTLIVEEIPVFKGSFGLSQGHMSVKIKDKIMLTNI